MYTHVLFALVILALWIETGHACSSRRRNPPPPPPPPPGAPKVPPTPPAVVKVVRDREQVMSRNNCKQVEVTAANSGQLQSGMEIVGASSEEVQRAQEQLKNEGRSDQCLNAEQFKYVCEFSVYSEIALTTIYHPTGCGCAFTIQVVKPRVRKPDVANLMSVNAAYSTKVTRFAIVVFDVVAKQVQEEIPEFSNMALSPETTAMIEAQVAADPNGDFASITAGFAGNIKSFSNLPKTLDKNDPANENYVPAIQFSIEQVYTTGAMFKVPCSLKMHKPPNAYMSQCQPYRPTDAFSYSKRHALNVEEAEAATDKAWFREFYMFPKQEAQDCGTASSGYVPKSRYITSFYNENNCAHKSGYLSFDREFESTFEASTAVVGGWKWKREFGETRVVFGVPHSFSKLNAIWCLGYSQINWVSPSQFQKTDVAIEKGVCTKLDVANPSAQAHKYGETHASYPIVDGQVACSPIYSACAQDTTLLGFQNNDPRDFEKRPSSILLTGPRRLFCSSHDQEGSDRVVFDTLNFRGVMPGKQLAKRNTFDDSLHPEPHHIHMVYDEERDGLVHGRHAPTLVARFNQHRRKRGEDEMRFDPVAAPPHRDNFALNNAAGSIDYNGADSAPAGDHPMRVFPETYSAPLTLDPVQSASEDEPLTYDGQLVNGVPPKICDLGDLGCTCRETSVGAPCDHPYECNGSGYCVRPECPAGKAGCEAHTDASCDGDLKVDANGFCVYAPACELGSIGCECSAEDACNDSGAECADGVCIVPMDGQCADGNPGCACTAESECSGGAVCDSYSGMCVFKNCATGNRGCLCNKEGNPCEDGFVCSGEGRCVESACVPGDAGCRCLDNKGCNKKGFKCVELNKSGTDNVCVGVDLCAEDQTKRCIEECGPGNVAVCGSCSYSQPICRDENIQYCNPKSYLYKVQPCAEEASASAFVASFAALFIALLAAF